MSFRLSSLHEGRSFQLDPELKSEDALPPRWSKSSAFLYALSILASCFSSILQKCRKVKFMKACRKLDHRIFVLHDFHFLFIVEIQYSFFPDNHRLCLRSSSDSSRSNYRYCLRSVRYSNYGFSCSWYWKIPFTHRSDYLCEGYFLVYQNLDILFSVSSNGRAHKESIQARYSS